MTELEKRLIVELKLEIAKSFIFSLHREYEKLQDTDNFDDLQAFEKNEINGKEKILREIKDFMEKI